MVIPDEYRRADALALVTDLRQAGISVQISPSHAKVAKQFQSAEKSGARFAIIIGEEFPRPKIQSPRQPLRGNLRGRSVS